MKSLLPSEKVLVPLVLQAQNGTNRIKAFHTLLEMVDPYLVRSSTVAKYRFNGSCPVIDAGDLAQRARIILVERIIPNWSINQGLFTHYFTKTIRLEMFNMINKESKNSKLVRPLQTVNFEGKDDPVNDEEGSLHRPKNKGQLPSQPVDDGFLLTELKYMLEKSVKPKNPIGAHILWYEFQHGKIPVRRYKNVPKSTVARKRKKAVTMLKKVF